MTRKTDREPTSAVAGTSKLPTYLNTRELMDLLKVRSRRTLAKRIAAGAVPKPIKQGTRARLWDLERVKRHLARLATNPT